MSISLIKEEEHILRVLPILLKKDDLFRREVSFILSDTLATKDEIKQILEELRLSREESNRKFEAADKRFEEMREESNRKFEERDKRFEEILEEMRHGFETVDKQLEEQRKETKKLGMSIRTIGARWGKETEITIRKTLQELLLKKLEAKDVSEWKIKDKEGRVGFPNSQIQVDLLIRNGEHLLAEIKSSADEAHVDRLYKIGELYTKKTGITPKLLFVAVTMEEEGVELCQKLGIQLITYDELE